MPELEKVESKAHKTSAGGVGSFLITYDEKSLATATESILESELNKTRKLFLNRSCLVTINTDGRLLVIGRLSKYIHIVARLGRSHIPVNRQFSQ